MKALVGAFNQEKALVGAFSVIVQLVVEPMDRFAALLVCDTNILHNFRYSPYSTMFDKKLELRQMRQWTNSWVSPGTLTFASRCRVTWAAGPQPGPGVGLDTPATTGPWSPLITHTTSATSQGCAPPHCHCPALSQPCLLVHPGRVKEESGQIPVRRNF